MPTTPMILLLGASGQLGKLIAKQLQHDTSIHLRVTSRHPSQLPELAKVYGDAVFLDLDDPTTFADALRGTDRLFLLTGYSVSMVAQSKTLLDAAKKAGVTQVVHLGVFSRDWACTVPHFAWHQMIEVYIQHLGFQYTFLHPNCFLQNLLNFSLIKHGQLRWYAQNVSCGWIALEDVAEAAAKIFKDGPSVHSQKDYWFSTESKTLTEMTQLLTDITGCTVTPDPQSSSQFLSDQGASQKTLDPYVYSVAESFKQIEHGQASYISEVNDDIQTLLGRKGMSVRQWMLLHQAELTQLIKGSGGSHSVWGNT